MPSFRRPLLGLMTSLALGIAGMAVPMIPGTVQPGYAQVSAEFQEALESYGHWARSARFGEVWVPDELPVDWRPYQYGHWVYTDDWGWYWISDPEEEDWGWVVYHYGRWAHERSLGWFWIPDDEWGPAWVDWRYGGDYVGWAPLPPDEVIEEYDDDPAYWVFVSPRYLAAPRWRSYMVPQSRRAGAFGRTRVVNRSVGYGRGRAAVNPGISPAFVARASRAPVATFRVSPRVLAGTQGVSGAVRVTPQQLQAGRSGGQRGRRPTASGANAVTVQRTSAVALPVGPAAPPPQPLNKGERGRLGTHPPRAAQGAPPPQQQLPPQQRQQQQGAPPSQPPVQRQQQQGAPPPPPPPPSQPQRAAPPAPAPQAAPPPPPPANAPPPPAQRREPPPGAPPPPVERPERPPSLPPGAPPPPVERRERPPEPQQHAPPPAGAPPQQQRPQPPAARPEPPRPPPPAAARPEAPRPPPPPAVNRPPPPAAARPAPPPPAAKPAPPPPPAAKPEEKKPPDAPK
jgi:hypothetical protein